MFWITITFVAPLTAAWGPPGTPVDVRPLAAYADEESLVYAQLSEPLEQLALLRDHPWIVPLRPEGGWLAAAEDPELSTLVSRMERELDAPLEQIARDLFGEGVALSLVPAGSEPELLVTFRAKDANAAQGRLEQVLSFAARASGLPSGLAEPHTVRDGARWWSIGPELALAQMDELLFVAGDQDVLEDAVERRRDRNELGLLRSDAFRSVHAELDVEGGVWAFVDAPAVRALSEHAQGDLGELFAMGAQPGALFVLGAALAGLPRAEAVGASLEVHRDSIDLALCGTGCDDTLSRLRPSEPSGPDLFAEDEHDVLRARLYRDLATLSADRAVFVEADALPEFSSGFAELGALFAGLELDADLLPALSPWFETLVRPVDFAPSPIPSPRLPAAAFALRLDEPERIGPALEAAFQSAIAVQNFERAAQRRPGLRLALGMHDGHTYSYAHVPPLAEGEAYGVEANLEPACCVVGDRFLIATHRALLLDVLDEWSRPAARPRTEVARPRTEVIVETPSESLELDAAPLADLARAQLETAVELLALSEGAPREQVRAYLTEWLGRLEHLELDAHLDHGEGSARLDARLSGWDR